MPANSLNIPANVCKSFKVQVNDVELPIDDILVLEFNNSFFEFGLVGYLGFRDSYSLLNSSLLTFDGKTKITLTINDFFGDYKQWVFNVIDQKIDRTSPRVNQLMLMFTDELNYKLQNTFIVKSFNGDVVSGFQSIFNQYGFQDLLTAPKLSTDFVPASNSDHYTISSNISLSDFFTSQFRLSNVRLWQDNYKLYLKEFKLSEIKGNFPMTLPNGNKLVYSNKTNNTNYAFKIQDYKKSNASKNKMLQFSQTQEVVRFKNKQVIRDTINLTDFYSEMLLNGNNLFSDMQDTQGKKFSVNNDSVEAQKYDLFNTFIQNEGLQITVAGNVKYNNVGYIAEVALSDRTPYMQSILSGDTTGSGLYLITAVRYKFIHDAFIQRLTLNRFDPPKNTA